MPYTVSNPDSLTREIGIFDKVDFKYAYPNKLNLKPGSELHQKILGRITRYAQASATTMRGRHKSWEEIDEKLAAYIPTTQKELEIKDKDRRKPISIVFPYSYAILETLVSYLVAAFFPEPIFRYEGVGPEDIAGSMLLEKVINLHCNKSKVALNLHTMFRDASVYGFGVVSPQWTVKRGTKITKQPIGYVNNLGSMSQTGWTRQMEEVTLFEGNCLHNIDPYRYLPDPSVSLHDVQRGEFVGWLDKTNYMDLLSEEQTDEDLFNVRYLRGMSSKLSSVFGPGMSTDTRFHSKHSNSLFSRGITDPIDQLHMYVKLIPRQWEIGNSDIPEKWLFTVAGDAVIIRAKPLGLNHNMFPVAICAPDFDGYSPIAHSRLEILGGMQTVIDFLFNSHIANVRKAINDKLIVDPFLINMKDLESSEPGGFARMRRPAWGKNLLDGAVKQLAITDITQRNMGDVAAIIQYMQQIGGTDNPIMGSLRTRGPERLTGAEFKGTAQGAVSRLERIAKVIGVQAMQDIGHMFAYHTQQLMTEDVYLKAAGDWPETVKQQLGVQNNRVRVTPNDILVDYDTIVRDGSIPGGNDTSIMAQLFKVIAENQQLLQQFDIVRIFEWIAVNEGAKNIHDFRLQQSTEVNASVLPDEQIQRQVQQGNLVPVQGGINGTGQFG